MRTTIDQLYGTRDTLNAMLAKRGSVAAVFVEQRNGHCALDLGNTAGKIQKTLTVGTKSEVWDYMHAMMESLWLLEPPYGEQTLTLGIVHPDDVKYRVQVES